jgi:hypothetical protein
MQTLSEQIVLASVTVLANGDLRVERVAQILRAGELAHSTPSIEFIAAGDDLSRLELEPIVLQLAAAAWSPAQIQAAADRTLETMRANAVALQAEQDAATQKRADELLQAQLQATRQLDSLKAAEALIEQHRVSLSEQRKALEAAHTTHLEHMAHLDEQETLLHERRKKLHQETHAQNVAEQRNA